MKVDTVLVTAYALAPQNTAYYERNKYMGIILEINKETDVIVDASSTFLSPLTVSFFRKLVIGTNICTGMDELVEDIKAQYLAPSVQSVIVAMKAAQKKYLESIKKRKEDMPTRIRD